MEEFCGVDRESGSSCGRFKKRGEGGQTGGRGRGVKIQERGGTLDPPPGFEKRVRDDSAP